MKIPHEVADVFRAVAPTLGLALGGPLGGAVAKVASTALDRWVVPGGPGPATPEDVVAAVQKNAGNDEMTLDLKRAELAVKDYELRMKRIDAKFDLLKLEVQDRGDAREFSRDTGLAGRIMTHGFAILYGGMFLLLLTIAGSLALISGAVRLPAEAAGIAAGVFSLIGVAIGYVNGYGSQIVSFYWGSSQGSKEKTEQLGGALHELGQALAAAEPVAPPAPPPIILNTPPPMNPPAIQDGAWHQGRYGGQRWRLTAAGVVLEGETAPMRTVGQPATVRRIWKEFGHLIAASCARNGVPLELVVATIGAEGGLKPRALLIENDGRRSAGPMQTLIGTASEMMERPVTEEELYDPATSIEAGTRYIAHQRRLTDYQPPLVAAAYNAGGLYPSDANPWRLRSTGDHISRLCQFFGDACAVAQEDGWQHMDKAA